MMAFYGISGTDLSVQSIENNRNNNQNYMPSITTLHILTLFLLLLSHLTNPALIIEAEPPQDSPLRVRQQHMLKLINSVRSRVSPSLPKLQLDPQLNALAQEHTTDMVTRKFFDHVNPDNLSPAQRAAKKSFPYIVGENIAIGSNISHIHDSLMKSPGHYNNTVKEQWTRCGIGFQYNKIGWLYATVVFSVRDLEKYPVTTSELARLQKGLVAEVMAGNGKLGREDTGLSTAISKYYTSMTSKTIAPTTTIWQYLKNVKYSRPGVKYTNQVIKLPWSDKLIQKVRTGKMFTSGQEYRSVGVGLRLVGGIVEITAVYASQ